MNAELQEELSAEEALDRALDSLAAAEIPDRLRERLLARFDRFMDGKNASISRRVARLITFLRELVWPGAPWWQPACALSLSVLIGLSAGLVIPDSVSDSGDQQIANISDTPTSVDVEQGGSGE